jgi:hypothetical protein
MSYLLENHIIGDLNLETFSAILNGVFTALSKLWQYLSPKLFTDEIIISPILEVDLQKRRRQVA